MIYKYNNVWINDQTMIEEFKKSSIYYIEGYIKEDLKNYVKYDISTTKTVKKIINNKLKKAIGSINDLTAQKSYKNIIRMLKEIAIKPYQIYEGVITSSGEGSCFARSESYQTKQEAIRAAKLIAEFEQKDNLKDYYVGTNQHLEIAVLKNNDEFIEIFKVYKKIKED